MLRHWRQQPPGTAYEVLVLNRHSQNKVKFKSDILKMSEEEFIVAMKADGSSDHLIERELPRFLVLKADYDRRMDRLAAKRAGNKGRDVGEDLQPYSDAEERRKKRRRENRYATEE